MDHNYPNRICKYESENFDDYVIDSILSLSNLVLENNYSSLLLSAFKLDFVKMMTKFIYHYYYIFKGSPTEGQKLFNTTFDYSKDKVVVSDNLLSNDYVNKFTDRKKIIYIFLKVILPFILKNKLFINKISFEYIENHKSSKILNLINILKRFFFKIKIERLINLIELTYSIMNLINFLIFLYNGKYPSLITRFLNINFIKIDQNNNSGFLFNILLKKILLIKIADILVYIFKFNIGRERLGSLLCGFSEINSRSFNLKKSKENNICGICEKLITGMIKLKCGCKYCYFCIESHRANSNNHCPCCFAVIV